MARCLYIFLDEAGNFDFSSTGTRYFVISSITTARPFSFEQPMSELQYDLIESGLLIEYFHATEDRQEVRNRVFKIIAQHLSSIRVDSVIIEKRKTGPALRPVERFYPKMIGYLLRYVITRELTDAYNEVIIITDAIPVKGLRRAVEKATKTTLANMLPSNIRYKLLHHDSKAHFGLQVADYCNWAVYRKWSSNDIRSYEFIKGAVKSEFDIFKTGNIFYY